MEKRPATRYSIAKDFSSHWSIVRYGDGCMEFLGYAHTCSEAKEIVHGIMDGKETFKTKAGYLRLK